MAGFIGVSNLIERDGHTITVRPEKITLLEDGQPDPPGTHVESGQIKDVIYAGVLTRYVVKLDGGGELVVSRQNTEAPDARDGGAPSPGDGSASPGGRSRHSRSQQDPNSGEG